MGYTGQLLRVDLAAGRTEPVPLDRGLARDYIGGSALAAGLMARDLLSGRSPDELDLYVLTGPLAGTPAPMASRWTVAGRSPQTGLWGEANAGGFFGAELKHAGWDGIIVSGRSDTPVALIIDDGEARLEAAGDLWGQDTFTVNARLARADGVRRFQALSIGPAGEHGVAYAGLVHERGYCAARTGLGTAFGERRLKAVACRGSGRVRLADPDRFAHHRAALLERLEGNILVQTMQEQGTMAAMDMGVMIGDVPVSNWRRGAWAGFEELSGTRYNELYTSGRRTCSACPIGCRREVTVTDGPYATDGPVPGPEYETCGALGALLEISDLPLLFRANELCNRYGLDTISLGATLAFAAEAGERGLWPDGVAPIRMGEGTRVLELIPLIARREGPGRLLALGVKGLAALIGPEADAFRTDVKGLETPMHDPRPTPGMAVAYGSAARGACHNASLNWGIAGMGAFFEEVPGLEGPFDVSSSEGMGRLTVLAEDLGQAMLTGFVFCALAAGFCSLTDLIGLLNAATGEGNDVEAVQMAGARTWLTKRAISCRLGLLPGSDRLPQRLRTPVADGPAQGLVPDFAAMLAEYYAVRGLAADGRPTPAALAKAGLDHLGPLLDR
ncbi:MAG: aldehyde ferredoxin oxidoreductase C-terminal domain-containing protein [Bacillota bacterium]